MLSYVLQKLKRKMNLLYKQLYFYNTFNSGTTTFPNYSVRLDAVLHHHDYITFSLTLFHYVITFKGLWHLHCFECGHDVKLEEDL